MMMGTALRAFAHPTDFLQRLGLVFIRLFFLLVVTLCLHECYAMKNSLFLTAGKKCGLGELLRIMGIKSPRPLAFRRGIGKITDTYK